MSDDVHNRHQVPSRDNKAAAETKAESKPVKLTAQQRRDAHFYENGVKADGTGGKEPALEGEGDA